MTVNITYPSVSSGSGSESANDPMTGNPTNYFLAFRNYSNINFIDLPDSRLGTTYNVRIIAENILGNGTTSYLNFSK